jgi:NADPH:quinone reductase-like Zn-dependent oxidoreductase
MPRAVRYDEFGGIDVLRVDEVQRPVPGSEQVLVRVKAAGINPSEAVIRSGAVSKLFPSTFPSGQGSDLAGVIEEVGAGVGGFSPGDEVIGFTQKRASQAELGPSPSALPIATRSPSRSLLRRTSRGADVLPRWRSGSSLGCPSLPRLRL